MAPWTNSPDRQTAPWTNIPDRQMAPWTYSPEGQTAPRQIAPKDKWPIDKQPQKTNDFFLDFFLRFSGFKSRNVLVLCQKDTKLFSVSLNEPSCWCDDLENFWVHLQFSPFLLSMTKYTFDCLKISETDWD